VRILVIEDNPDMAANLVEFLEAKGHTMDVAADGIWGLHLASTQPHDAIVLDVMLPGIDGLTLCRRLRTEARINIPVLMLTARDTLDDKIAGLEAGADDYVVKPFALREVEARLRALSRRAQGKVSTTTLQIADLSFDPGTYRVNRAGNSIELPPIPMKLLEALMRASPQVLTRPHLEHEIWGDSPPDSDALRAHMHVLRSAIDKPGMKPLLVTIRSLGYQLFDSDVQQK